MNRVLLEERSWFCGFVNAFTRVLVSLMCRLYIPYYDLLVESVVIAFMQLYRYLEISLSLFIGCRDRYAVRPGEATGHLEGPLK